MESDGFIYFQLNINFDGQRTESTFIKCKPKQTIGDAIFDNMADENVAIVKVPVENKTLISTFYFFATISTFQRTGFMHNLDANKFLVCTKYVF